jgi:hypothetical protein
MMIWATNCKIKRGLRLKIISEECEGVKFFGKMVEYVNLLWQREA